MGSPQRAGDACDCRGSADRYPVFQPLAGPACRALHPDHSRDGWPLLERAVLRSVRQHLRPAQPPQLAEGRARGRGGTAVAGRAARRHRPGVARQVAADLQRAADVLRQRTGSSQGQRLPEAISGQPPVGLPGGQDLDARRAGQSEKAAAAGGRSAGRLQGPPVHVAGVPTIARRRRLDRALRSHRPGRRHAGFRRAGARRAQWHSARREGCPAEGRGCLPGTGGLVHGQWLDHPPAANRLLR
ncbi:hypothetical protein D9M71_411610 [compost metagenome]